MDCRRIERLVPLYIEGDLKPDRLNAVSEHLRSCATCSRLVEEFRESQEWLLTYQPPEFEDELFEKMRAAVLSDIENRGSFAIRMQSFALTVWGRRIAVATGVTVLLLAGILLQAYFVNRSSSEPDRGIAVENKETRQPEEERTAEADPGEIPDLHDKRKRSWRPSRRLKPRERQPDTFLSQPHQEIASAEGDPATAVEPDFHSETPPHEEWVGSAAETLRIEIQTGDPNIRIIWFAPRSTNP